MGASLCTSDAAIAPSNNYLETPEKNHLCNSYLITDHMKHAASVLGKYPMFCEVFLEFVSHGRWIPEFLDSNPNLFSMLNRPDSETQFQMFLRKSSVHNSTVTLVHELSESNSGMNAHLLSLDVSWISSPAIAEPLLAVILACAFPLFLQSRDFEVWYELFSTESVEQATLGNHLLHDTMMFRLVDSHSDEYLESEQNESVELRDLQGTFTTVLHPQVKHITFAHRPKSVRESISSRVAHRAYRVEAIIRRLLLPMKQPDTLQSMKAMFSLHSTSMQNINKGTTLTVAGSENNSNSSPETSPRHNHSHSQSLPRPPSTFLSRHFYDRENSHHTSLQQQQQSLLWLQHIQQFMETLPIPIFIARVCNHEHDNNSPYHLPRLFGSHSHSTDSNSPLNSTFTHNHAHHKHIFPSEHQHFTILATNSAYLHMTQRTSQEVVGRTVYEMVLQTSRILSQHCPARGPAADSALSALYPMHFLLHSERSDGSQFPNLFMLKPVHHVLAHPSHHYLIAVQYDLSPPPPQVMDMAHTSARMMMLQNSMRTKSERGGGGLTLLRSSLSSPVAPGTPTNNNSNNVKTSSRILSPTDSPRMIIQQTSATSHVNSPTTATATSTNTNAVDSSHKVSQHAGVPRPQNLRRSVSEFPAVSFPTTMVEMIASAETHHANTAETVHTATTTNTTADATNTNNHESSTTTTTTTTMVSSKPSIAPLVIPHVSNLLSVTPPLHHTPTTQHHQYHSSGSPHHHQNTNNNNSNSGSLTPSNNNNNNNHHQKEQSHMHHTVIAPLLAKMLHFTHLDHTSLLHYHTTHSNTPVTTTIHHDAAANNQPNSSSVHVHNDNKGQHKYETPSAAAPAALSFQKLEEDMPMIEDVLNLLPHLLF